MNIKLVGFNYVKYLQIEESKDLLLNHCILYLWKCVTAVRKLSSLDQCVPTMTIFFYVALTIN